MNAPTEPTELQFEEMAEFAGNIARAAEVSQKIAAVYMDGQASQDKHARSDPLNVLPAMAHFFQAIADRPGEMMDVTQRYWSGQMAAISAAHAKLIGAEPESEKNIPNLPEGGRRFSHAQWSENAGFEYIKRSYLLAAKWSSDVLDVVETDLSSKERRKIEFITRNVVEALNPANFATLNPEVMETTLSERGANLVRGAEMMLEDMTRGKGELLIRHTDMSAFEVGDNLAVSPGKVVFENRIFQLIQYAPTTKKVHQTPLLFIPPWINKYYVLDLNTKKSMIKWLVAQGHTVFLMSWVNPSEEHGAETWASYMEDGASTAIDKVLEETGGESVNLASYCIGGTLAGTLMAKLGREKDSRVKSATFFTAQLDFEDAGELQAFVDEQILAAVDDEAAKGFLPAKSMATAFNTLRANDLIWSYMVNNYMLGKEPFPFDLLYWNSDSTCMPAQVHHYYLEQFYINNAFSAGTLDIGTHQLGVGDITAPVYHVATVEDHIAPAASVYCGARQMTQADMTFVLAGSGHIAGVVNPPKADKYQYWIDGDTDQRDIGDWQASARLVPGSWWPHWDAWLQQFSAKKVDAREPGSVLTVLEDAPGSYVKVRFDGQ